MNPVVDVVEPLVALTTMVEVPVGVPEFGGGPWLLLLPPPPQAGSNMIDANISRRNPDERRRPEVPSSTTEKNMKPTRASQF